jgi:hypothetical protein
MIIPRAAQVLKLTDCASYGARGWKSAVRGCALAGLAFLCVHAAGNSIEPKFPIEAAMNQEAGRGGRIILTFRLDDGQELPLMVDTGSPWTILDNSLKPKLGKRIGSTTVGRLQPVRIERLDKYRAPKLYLGTFLLSTSNDVVLADHFKDGSSMGILGLDVLRHYRIQLDFQTGSFCLLGTNDLKAAELGKAFPLTYSGGHAAIHHDGLFGSSTNIIIDTGCNTDGLVNKGGLNGVAVILPQRVWDGGNYTGLVVVAADHVNVLGLGFLARHLVTFDFPNRIMYLKQIMSKPLAGNVFREISSAHAGPVEFLVHLKEKGQLPGFSRKEEATIYYKNSDLVFRPYGLIFGRWEKRKSLTFDFCKNEDSSIFHYRVVRLSGNDPWKLKKAWRTDQKGGLIEEYPIPFHSA